ncbi:hypothetical protein [Microbacterium sp. SD291]|uniref:hypothetical protein n=1 Tax=Microbacterium sp. SD291 TaxID=2782007 RepID=UPI001A96230D|nr:hypothetical protein [Microbacterium sp. SD291]MBO0981589.1 hypothetical protein [Microbacterium sp. SD291]
MSEIENETPRNVDRDDDGVATAPEAVEATSVRSRRRWAVVNPASYRGRGVEWVRPTDLMARSGSRVAGAGINFQAELHRRTRDAATTSIRGIAERARRLSPASAFGHGSSRRGTERSAVGAA